MFARVGINGHASVPTAPLPQRPAMRPIGRASGALCGAPCAVHMDRRYVTYSAHFVREAAAKRDQALAVLFYRSGWTQEELAKKEAELTNKPMSQQRVAERLRFGRFLNFTASGSNSEILPKISATTHQQHS
jgi:hypothetical protein